MSGTAQSVSSPRRKHDLLSPSLVEGISLYYSNEELKSIRSLDCSYRCTPPPERLPRHVYGLLMRIHAEGLMRDEIKYCTAFLQTAKRGMQFYVVPTSWLINCRTGTTQSTYLRVGPGQHSKVSTGKEWSHQT